MALVKELMEVKDKQSPIVVILGQAPGKAFAKLMKSKGQAVINLSEQDPETLDSILRTQFNKPLNDEGEYGTYIIDELMGVGTDFITSTQIEGNGGVILIIGTKPTSSGNFIQMNNRTGRIFNKGRRYYIINDSKYYGHGDNYLKIELDAIKARELHQTKELIRMMKKYYHDNTIPDNEQSKEKSKNTHSIIYANKQETEYTDKENVMNAIMKLPHGTREEFISIVRSGMDQQGIVQNDDIDNKDSASNSIDQSSSSEINHKKVIDQQSTLNNKEQTTDQHDNINIVVTEPSKNQHSHGTIMTEENNISQENSNAKEESLNTSSSLSTESIKQINKLRKRTTTGSQLNLQQEQTNKRRRIDQQSDAIIQCMNQIPLKSSNKPSLKLQQKQKDQINIEKEQKTRVVQEKVADQSFNNTESPTNQGLIQIQQQEIKPDTTQIALITSSTLGDTTNIDNSDLHQILPQAMI